MNLVYKYTAALALVAGLFVSCKNENAEYSPLRNRAYIAQSSTKANGVSVINVSEDKPGGETLPVNVRLSDVQKEENTFRLSLFTQEELDVYNKANGTDYVILPTDRYRLSTNEVKVKAGSVLSEDVDVTILPLNREQIASGNKYVLPLKLTRVAGSTVINGGDEFLYAVKPTIISSVPVLGTYRSEYRKASSGFNDKEVTTTQWTVEMRVNMNGFRINNQALFGHQGSPEIYARFGDAPIPFNSINIKVAGSQIDRTNMLFEPNRWYHVAFVYNGNTLAVYVDGNKDIDTDKMSGKTFTFKGGVTVAGSGSYYFQNALMVSEVRVWTVARTPAQLKEYEYSVPPTSPGLLEYWKMDEASGREFKNSVPGGKSMFVLTGNNTEATPVWLDNVRSDGAGRTRVD